MQTALLKSLAILALVPLLLVGCTTDGPLTQAHASQASASQITQDSRRALASLYAQNAVARSLGRQAKGVLVFPSIVRAGLIWGGQMGQGALFDRQRRVRDFFQTTSLSWGLQAGVQQFGYALFFMDDEALRNLDRLGGWEVGSSPSLVIIDQGVAGAMNTTTLNRGIYAFFFDQRGLMGGLGFQGTRITRIQPAR